MRRVFIAVLALAAVEAQADVFTFQTPSGNIQCSVGLEVDGSDIRCVVIERGGPPAAPRPAWCASDWGHVFFMRNRGLVEMSCEPLDRSRYAQETAEYGVTGEFGGLTCLSTREGLNCVNEDGRGFFLSRGSQRAF